MRLLVAHDVHASRTGGMSRLMGFIHDRLIPRGCDVDYFHAENAPGSRPLRRLSFPLSAYAYARTAAAAGQPYQLLNIHEPSAVACVLGRRSLGHPKIVVTTHGVEQRGWELALAEQRLGRDGPSLKSRIVYPISSLWQSRVGLTRADHVFCLNHEDHAYLVNRFGIDERRVTRIYPGADAVYADAAPARDYRGAENLLFAATWRKNKGIEDLVPAVTGLVERYPRLRLTVLGPGVAADAVRDAFPERARGAIRCVTVSTDEEAAAVYANADLFVLPSLFEGTPLTLVEAMASGLPIATTAVCGMKDLIESGRNGLLMPIRSPEAIVRAVSELIDNPDLRRRLGTAARLDARTHYTWDLSADRVASIYERLLGGQWVKAAKAS